MARAINILSAGFVSKVKKRGTYSDGGGLILRVAPGVSKQWQFRYRLQYRERYLGLGGLQTVSLSQAREAAMSARQMLLSGLDPIEERRKLEREVIAENVRAITFEQACKQYIAAHEASWRNVKHRKQWRSSFETYAWPTVGKLAVANIDTAAVVSVLEPIWRTKTETASRLRGRIESVLDWATVQGYREGENPARWRGHLEALLPARSKVQRVRHHSALTYSELGSFVAELREWAGFAAIALEFTILTAAPVRGGAGRHLGRDRPQAAGVDGASRADEGRARARGAAH